MIFRIFFILLCIPALAYTKINVVTTTTDLKWLVEKIGGDKVKVYSLLNGTEDPHFVDAMPHFVNKVANADMFCLVGLDLEVGWVPRVLARSGNKRVQPGGKGYCDTGTTVNALDIPKNKINRSHGDIHAMGNPHYHLGPNAFVQGGQTVFNILVSLDTKNTKYYQSNYKNLKENMKLLKIRVNKILSPLKGKSFMEYHKEFTYFLKEFGLKNIGAIEAVPGVPPSAGRLARVSIYAKQSKVSAVLAATNSPKNLTDKFAQMSNIKVARLPISITPSRGINSYEQLLKFIANTLVKITKSYEQK